MKNVHLLPVITLILLAISCNNESPEAGGNNQKPAINFESTVYDFGTIIYGGDGRCYFDFTNDSEEDLIINNVHASCGCTRPEWPKEPVKPGDSGRIGVSYNTLLKGSFHKTITVYSNAENSPVKLFIKGTVEKK